MKKTTFLMCILLLSPSSLAMAKAKGYNSPQEEEFLDLESKEKLYDKKQHEEIAKNIKLIYSERTETAKEALKSLKRRKT